MTDYFSENMWQLWAIISVLCLILELSSGDFFIICFAIGAFGAVLVSPFVGVLWQLAVFALVSALSIFWVRPFALRYLHRNDKGRSSNADALIGRRGVVSSTINAGAFGRVAIDGDDWKAVAETNETIPEGAVVEVVGRESIIITVKPISTNH